MYAHSDIKPELGISSDEAQVDMLKDTNMSIEFLPVCKTIIDGNVEPFIRTAEVARAASDIQRSAFPARLLCTPATRTRKEAAVRLDGRDIGTYVFPMHPINFS